MSKSCSSPRQHRKIRGLHYGDNGTLVTPVRNYMDVEVDQMGNIYDPLTNIQLQADREEIAQGVFIDVISTGVRGWKFNADAGECERAGIDVNYNRPDDRE